jgi:hypothetical protein
MLHMEIQILMTRHFAYCFVSRTAPRAVYLEANVFIGEENGEAECVWPILQSSRTPRIVFEKTERRLSLSILAIRQPRDFGGSRHLLDGYYIEVPIKKL